LTNVKWRGKGFLFRASFYAGRLDQGRIAVKTKTKKDA
jgi:hypothetical protein